MTSTYWTALIYFRPTGDALEHLAMGAIAFDPWAPVAVTARLASRGRVTRSYNAAIGDSYAFLARDFQVRLRTVVRRWAQRRAGADRADSLFAPHDMHAAGRAVAELWDQLRYDEDAALVLPAPSAHLARSAGEALSQLYDDMVGQFEEFGVRHAMDDDRARTLMHNRVAALDADKGDLQENVEVDLGYRLQRFAFAWTNGVRNYADAITFDLTKSDAIVDKAEKWKTRLTSLRERQGARFTMITHPPRRTQLLPAYDTAIDILRDTQAVREIIPTTEIEALPLLIAADAKHEH